jgi:hypothetical protein
MLRISGMLQGLLPDDDRSVAFAPEIDAADRRHGESRYDDRQFLKPIVDRLAALSRIAKSVRPVACHASEESKDEGHGAGKRKRRGFEKGGDVTILSQRGIGDAKIELAKDCFWLLSNCFGQDVEQKISGTIEHSKKRKGPSFVNLLNEVFRLAVGDEHPNESFAQAVRIVVAIKSESIEWWRNPELNPGRRNLWMRGSPLHGFVLLQFRNSADDYLKPKNTT